jgi:hypothetical protein
MVRRDRHAGAAVTQKLSTTLANQLANTIANTFNDGYLDLFSGSPGVTPEDTSKGILLATMKLPMAAFGTAINGVLTLAGQWFGTAIEATTRLATWGRFRDHGNTIYLVVIVTGPGQGGEITLDNAALVFGQVVEVTSFTYTVPVGDD